MGKDNFIFRLPMKFGFGFRCGFGFGFDFNWGDMSFKCCYTVAIIYLATLQELKKKT